MTRFRLLIEYDGGGFVGWQRQDNGLGVQQVVEEAVTAFSGETTLVQCAGRTDAGVHAFGQVAHVDLARDWDGGRAREALNAHLRPYAVSVLGVEAVDDEFHARYSAIERTYEYRILNRRPPPALQRGHVWWVKRPLDADAMHVAAQELLGHHDFTSFRASVCQANSPMKTLDELSVSRRGEMVIITARARSFLHHQVRNMVGTLALVGEGKWSSVDVAKALAARSRPAGGPTAPAVGLFLVQVKY